MAFGRKVSFRRSPLWAVGFSASCSADRFRQLLDEENGQCPSLHHTHSYTIGAMGGGELAPQSSRLHPSLKDPDNSQQQI
jgi:hypothetical protein